MENKSYMQRAAECTYEFLDWDRSGRTIKIVDPVIMANTRDRNGNERIHKNFSGRPDYFNPQGGSHYFDMVIPDALAIEMERLGVKVNRIAPSDAYPEELIYIRVKVNPEPKDYSGNPAPLDYGIIMKSGGHESMVRVTKQTLYWLDDYRLNDVDIRIRVADTLSNPNRRPNVKNNACWLNYLRAKKAPDPVDSGRYSSYEFAEDDEIAGDLMEEDGQMPF